jgi:SAM-dependent methyltransferase
MSDENRPAIAHDRISASVEFKMPRSVIPALRCPGRPDMPLRLVGDWLEPVDDPRQRFPVVRGTPILIDERSSVFSIRDFTESGGITTMDLRDDTIRLATRAKRLRQAVGKLVPPKSRSITDFDSVRALDTILASNPRARILVLGAGDARFAATANAAVVYSDVALAPDTHVIADAHDIPFANATFEAVFAVAVLEHVADPFRCVAEIQRVLVPRGFVYAVTPFIQQVHMGRYDFTRFTALGHRRAFRWFDEERSGVANGPGMALAWSLEYLLSSMSENQSTRNLLRSASHFVTWPFLLLDGYIGRKRGCHDCASAYYFFGRLREAPVPDREIIRGYRGMN